MVTDPIRRPPASPGVSAFRAHLVEMNSRVASIGLAVLVSAAAACQQPSDGGEPSVSDAPLPEESPVAPAIQPEPTGPEQPIELPSAAPVAPAIEPEPTGPDPTIAFDGH